MSAPATDGEVGMPSVSENTEGVVGKDRRRGRNATIRETDGNGSNSNEDDSNDESDSSSDEEEQAVSWRCAVLGRGSSFGGWMRRKGVPFLQKILQRKSRVSHPPSMCLLHGQQQSVPTPSAATTTVIFVAYLVLNEAYNAITRRDASQNWR